MFARLMRRSLAVWLMGTFVLMGVPFGLGVRADESGAAAFINTLGADAVEIMKSRGSTTVEQREARFKELLIEGFHIKTIGRFVIGKYWKEATDEQKKAYDDVFPGFITRVYAARFDTYDGEIFELVQTATDPNGDDWVRTRINRPGAAQSIAVDYRVRLFDGKHKVVDVVVEGISMLNTHRVEFASVVSKHGFDRLIHEMQARVAAFHANTCQEQRLTQRAAYLRPKRASSAFASSMIATPLGDGLAPHRHGDYLAALGLWRTLAGQNEAVTQYGVGIVCAVDQGVRQDYAEAVTR